MQRPRAHSGATVEAAALLGSRIRLARRERFWTLEQLADRVGVGVVTMRKVERGDLTVAIGTVFEAATIVGVTLFDDDLRLRRFEAGRIDDRLALLPKRIQLPKHIDDDF